MQILKSVVITIVAITAAIVILFAVLPPTFYYFDRWVDYWKPRSADHYSNLPRR